MDERQRLEQAIEALEAQRAALGDAVVETALAPLREKLQALTSPAPDGLQGERKRVTILLADVKESTALAERLPMEDWVEVMNHVFQILETEIYRFGGEVNQFRGDGLLAFFGAREVHEDDPERAVLAALAMQAAMGRYAATLAQEMDVEVLLRVGINTGEVVVTQVGDRRQYSEATAMGRAVALAARLESVAAPGSVLVSAATYRLARAGFEWEALGEISVKGIAAPVSVYRPLARRAVPDKARGLAGLASPLVGRRSELRTLWDSVLRLLQGEGGVVTLVGEAGLGKSRLVSEVRRRARRRSDGLRWVEGRCVSYGTASAYLLWRDVVRDLLGVTARTPADRVRERLDAHVAALCPEASEDVTPSLVRLLALGESRDDPASEGAGVQHRVFEAVSRLVAAEARQAPLVIVCEDLHWADASSLALLTHLLPLIERVPLLFLCVFRPERQHGCWRLRDHVVRTFPRRHHDVHLRPLSAEHMQALLGNLLDLEALPERLRGRILDYAEGNPFYVEEIIRTLLDAGALVYDAEHGRWRARQRVDEIAIPDTLQGVLVSRIDRLPAMTKRVLQLAAVIGRLFQYRVLAAIAPANVDLDAHLQTLQQVELVRRRETAPEEERGYIFKHQLTQQAAYHSLLLKERGVVHRQVAEAVKRLFPGRLWEHAALLAYHWEHTGEPGRALPHLLRAADMASYSFANAEALDFLRRALDLARGADLKLAEAEVLYKSSYLLRRRGDYDEAQACLEQALPIYRTFGNQRRVGLLLTELGVLARRRGRYAEAYAHFERTLEISRLVGNRRGEVVALNHLGITCCKVQAWPQAGAHLDQALRLSRQLRFSWGEAVALVGLSDVHRCLGDDAVARAHLEAAQRITHRLGDRRVQSAVLVHQARLAHDQGDAAAALAHARRALDAVREIGSPSREADVLVVLAHAQLALGRLTEAEALYRQALRRWEALGELHRRGEAWAGLADVARRAGDVPRARACVADALEALEASQASLPAQVYLTCYHVLRDAAEEDRAAEVLATAHASLQAQAAAIEDPALRRSFLEEVVAHRTIVNLHAKHPVVGP
jgi:class 3 adenylate cyclase/tetratricopeptide (TPR) repeat protein